MPVSRKNKRGKKHKKHQLVPKTKLVALKETSEFLLAKEAIDKYMKAEDEAILRGQYGKFWP